MPIGTKNLSYKPILFIVIVYLVTWACACFLAFQSWFNYGSVIGKLVLDTADFLESASPLLAAIILLRTYLFREGNFIRFIFGEKHRILPYTIVGLLFLFQFFTFYLFCIPNGRIISISAFLSAWIGQILFGGGLEEGGWRGYLQSAFEQKAPVLLSVVLVSLIWAFWHIPYFFLPNSFLTGNSFVFYVVTMTATAFTLTAIYKLTGSVLLCTLFHGWQNAIVMNISADMGHPGFLTMFGVQTVISIILCINPLKRR